MVVTSDIKMGVRRFCFEGWVSEMSSHEERGEHTTGARALMI